MRKEPSALSGAGLMISVMAAPVFFGAVEPWALMGLCAWLFFLFFLSPPLFSELTSLPKIPLVAAVFLFGLIAWQAASASVNRFQTALELLKWLAFTAAFLLVLRVDEKTLWRLALAFVFIAAAGTVYGSLQMLLGDETVLWKEKVFHRGFLTGTYFNRNHMAGLLELALGFGLGLWYREGGLPAGQAGRRSLWRSAAWASACVLLAWGLFKTGSRMGILSFGAGLAFFSVLLGRREGRRALPFLAFLAAGFAVFMIFRGGVLIGRFAEVHQSLDTWEGGRSIAWEDTWRLIQDHISLGVGLGNFKWSFPAYQSERLVALWTHAHNDYLELMAELGIPGFAAWCITTGGLWCACWIRLRSLPVSLFPLAWGGLTGVTAMAVHGLADFNWAIPANAYLSMIALGILCRCRALARTSTP